MERLILESHQSPGDVLMLTAAVRDLHACHPHRFFTDVRTSCPALWENNPHLTALSDRAPDVRRLRCHYPLIHESNHRPVHFLQGFSEFLNRQLGLQIRTTRFGGDLHLSRAERCRPSPVQLRTGLNVPYWIIVAGGKYDFTIKWWQFRRWQAVVDHFRDRLLFVQVGEARHYHPPLAGVLSLLGQTTLRELVHLVYHAEGVVCPVTLLMHLAAAVEPRPGGPNPRPCVVVAGGRESPHWEAYPSHQFIHTVGVLPCCAQGGCWRSRIVPLGDGDAKDRPEHLCLRVVNGLPACMDLILPEDVCRRVEYYLTGPTVRTLTARQAAQLRPQLRTTHLDRRPSPALAKRARGSVGVRRDGVDRPEGRRASGPPV